MYNFTFMILYLWLRLWLFLCDLLCLLYLCRYLWFCIYNHVHKIISMFLSLLFISMNYLYDLPSIYLNDLSMIYLYYLSLWFIFMTCSIYSPRHSRPGGILCDAWAVHEKGRWFHASLLSHRQEQLREHEKLLHTNPPRQRRVSRQLYVCQVQGVIRAW